jgi:hypothetical protein
MEGELSMSEKKDEQKDKGYEQARSLAEDALDQYARGDKAKGDKLAEQAVKTNRAAVEDVVRELEEGAGAGEKYSEDKGA